MERISVVLAILVLGALPGGVRAERAVLLAVTSEPGVQASERAVVEAATARFFETRAPALEVLSRAAALPALSPALRGCELPECAGEVAKALAADLAILLRVFAADGQTAGSVNAALVTPGRIVYTGTSSLHGNDAAAATQQALSIAEERWRRGPGPWLRVRAPSGARVRLDGGAFESTPYLDRHEAGLHRVEVLAREGEVLYAGAVTLADDPATYEEIDLTSTVRSETASSPSAPRALPYFRRKRSPWNLYVGVPLAIAGVGMLSAGIAHFVKRGDCANDSCSDVHTVNSLSRALLVAGTGASVFSGTAFFAIGVIREPAASARGAVLRLQANF